MNRLFYLIFVLAINVVYSNDDSIAFSKTIKAALRNVGHELLLQNQDSTSLVKPILQLDGFRYELSFNKNLIIDPGLVMYSLEDALKGANINQDYLLEILSCNSKTVSYSAIHNGGAKQEVVPCSGRLLDKGCYTIELTIQNYSVKNEHSMEVIWIFNLTLFTLLILVLLFKLKKKQVELKKALGDDGTNLNYRIIGQFVFYPDQNVLIHSEEEVALSRKESEILDILSERPNETIKREELSKRVWEDQGVVVGRSLDTYISKLRKRLQQDPSIKLSNVHGVGYKLEIKPS